MSQTKKVIQEICTVKHYLVHKMVYCIIQEIKTYIKSKILVIYLFIDEITE